MNFDVLQVLVKREINRGLLAEAMANYHNYTLQPLVELLGIVHRPYRYDFRFRYISRDFPVEVIARVEPLFCVTDFADLIKKQQLAEALFAEALPCAETMIQQLDRSTVLNLDEDHCKRAGNTHIVKSVSFSRLCIKEV